MSSTFAMSTWSGASTSTDPPSIAQHGPRDDEGYLVPRGRTIRASSRATICIRERARTSSGRLRPGSVGCSRSLGREHHVSVPVREALRRLETEGFVTLTPYHGARFSESSWRDSTELMQVRRGLEVLAARLAVERRGGEYAEALGEAVAERGERRAGSASGSCRA